MQYQLRFISNAVLRGFLMRKYSKISSAFPEGSETSVSDCRVSDYLGSGEGLFKGLFGSGFIHGCNVRFQI